MGSGVVLVRMMLSIWLCEGDYSCVSCRLGGYINVPALHLHGVVVLRMNGRPLEGLSEA